MSDNSLVLNRCLEALLRPIMRFALLHGLRLQALIESLKSVLIETAVSELALKGEEISVSRISVMTGIHRAEVSRLYRFKEGKVRQISVVNRVIDTWQQDKRFTTKSGDTRVLRLEGMNSPFIKLVQSVSTALNPYTVLFELERNGIVQRTKNGIRLCRKVYLTKDLEEGYQMLGADVADLILAVEENLSSTTEIPNFHLTTEYDSIPLPHTKKIKAWLLREGSIFHKKLRKYLAQFDSEISIGDATPSRRARVAFGSFSRIENFDHKSSKKEV